MGSENAPVCIRKVQDNFEVLSKIGEGSFGEVYLARRNNGKKNEEELYALKYLTQICSTTRIKKELSFLTKFCDSSNIISVLLCIRENNNFVIVMPYIKHTKLSSLKGKLAWSQIRTYMYHLLDALTDIHSQHCIHRDVKSSNFLADFEENRFALIDFGLAQFTSERSKETIPLESSKESSSTTPIPGRKSCDDEDCLLEIMAIFGSEKVTQICQRALSKVVLVQPTIPQYPGGLRALCIDARRNFFNSDKENSPNESTNNDTADLTEEIADSCLDLIEQMLEVNPHRRISAKLALQHAFFKDS